MMLLGNKVDDSVKTLPHLCIAEVIKVLTESEDWTEEEIIVFAN